MKSFKIVSAFILMLLIVSLAACGSTSNQSSTGEYIDDTVITTKVKAEILNDPELKVMEINVETYKGTVQLSGFVSTQAHINRATQIARAVDGVVAVKNDIRMK
ncbi:BON domain-containing protein [Nitrincola alkalilacustris]|uniref:BON domain-containing protein n=1 Tax=Nitrincola alkalilacustris TaxID=1571224 RepID=UPI00124D323B|nr:BON domain-containing protein [Nitrincola alkalilacustris]